MVQFGAKAVVVLWLAGGLGSRWTSVAAGGKVRHVRSSALNRCRMLRLTREAGVSVEFELPFDPEAVLPKAVQGTTKSAYEEDKVIFSQGEAADSIFYINNGRVKLTVHSEQGKEAVVAILGPGDFLGEGCLTGQPRRMATAKVMTECLITRVDKAAMIRELHDDPDFSEKFMSHLLTRNIRVEADLVDQLFNSSEKRLARMLLILANFGKEGKPEPVIAKVSQEMLAEMIGTTRSRVSFFMNKFRKLGLIDYNGHLEVHSSLLNVVLHDDPHINGDPTGEQTASGSGQL
jgi:CRP-like cAMP-binding protein